MRRTTVTVLAAAAATMIALACGASASGPSSALGPEADSTGAVVIRRVTVDAAPNVFAGATSQLLIDDSTRDLTRAAASWRMIGADLAIVNENGVVAGRRVGVTRASAEVAGRTTETTIDVVPPDDSELVVIAHRGFRLRFPENTLVAIAGAFDLGADAVEIDVRLSRDGVPVVMHDETVDRTTNGTGRVQELDFAQLATLDACAKATTRTVPCALPSLQDALAAAHGRGGMLLHLYGTYAPDDLRGMLAMVRAADMDRHVVFICFDLATLRALRALDPVVALGFLSPALPSLDVVEALGRAAIIPDLGAASKDPAASALLLRDARRRGLDAATFTVMSSADAQTAVSLGFRRLITDLPLDREALRR